MSAFLGEDGSGFGGLEELLGVEDALGALVGGHELVVVGELTTQEL